jgi:ribosomal protein S18 acetylase RimI-like enzyme
MNCQGPAATPECDAAVTWRAATFEDEPFFREVYSSSLDGAASLAALTPTARRERIDRESLSRQATYRIDFPGVCFHVLELDGQQVGRCYLHDSPAEIFVVDLIFLAAWRGRGLGTTLMHRLIDEATSTGRRLRLHVEKANSRAFAFYTRLGFRIIGDLPLHHLLEYRPQS